MYGGPYDHKFYGFDIFFGISPVAKLHHVLGRAWFRDSAGAIDFYQMSNTQSKSTILHESIIYNNIVIFLTMRCMVMLQPSYP